MRWIMYLLRRWQEWRRTRAEEKARVDKAMEGLLTIERAFEERVAAVRGDMEESEGRTWPVRGGLLLGGMVVVFGGFAVIELFGSSVGWSIGGGVVVAAGLALACASAPWRR